MIQKLIYKNDSIKKFKSKFKKNQSRVYTPFGLDRNTKYKGINLCEYRNGEKYLGVLFRLRRERGRGPRYRRLYDTLPLPKFNAEIEHKNLTQLIAEPRGIL